MQSSLDRVDESSKRKSHGPEHGPHHVMPVNVYYAVYGSLLILTALTVAVSFAGLGPLAIPVAMAVAVVKAAFVIGYFMHLKYDTKFHSLVFFSGFLFLLTFFAFTMFDLAARGGLNPEADNFVKRNEAALIELEANGFQDPHLVEEHAEGDESADNTEAGGH